MPYTTTRIDRRNLVRLAGWGMTGLRSPDRGNMRTGESTASRLASQDDVVRANGVAANAEAVKADMLVREQE